MQLVKFIDWNRAIRTPRAGCLRDGMVRPAGPEGSGLASLLHQPNPREAALEAWERAGTEAEVPVESVQLFAPLDRHEVWGAGVTYERSKVAREAESEHAATFYDKVYRADRPELFFKASPNRVAGPGQPIRVRRDSSWTVPEPELALILSPQLQVVGYTVGNDVSARDIEGANPLYLPQAKTYDGSCALGPAITLPGDLPPLAELTITLTILRQGSTAFEDRTPVSRLVRTFDELIGWLGRDNQFLEGAILLTGTGIVPPDDFTLEAGDEVRIGIDGIGTLANPVVRG